jgi:diguanylate cyclase (GGDEF)-like protein
VLPKSSSLSPPSSPPPLSAAGAALPPLALPLPAAGARIVVTPPMVAGQVATPGEDDYRRAHEVVASLDPQLRALARQREAAMPLLLGLLLDEDGGDAPLCQRILDTMRERESWQGEVRFRRRSGETYPAWLMVSAVREGGKGGAVANHIGIAIDITDRKLNEERIRFLAHHDVLTELPNRSLCEQRLQAALAQARAVNAQVAVLFIDLDRFKSINDTLGHHIGDGLLRSVAARLTQSVRGQDTVSRLGGDEFVVVMQGVAGRADVQQLVEQRLIPLIRQAHVVEGHELHVSCSVGMALYPEDGQDLEGLMRRADAAMYEAKATGRDMACFYSVQTDQRALAR